jgi:hypothetical protein
MKNLILWLVILFLGGCMPTVHYSGPKSSNTASVTFEASGLVKHAAFANDTLLIALDEGGSHGLGAIKLTTDHTQANIRVDRGKALNILFMSFQPNFGGDTQCLVNVPFVADDSSNYIFAYSTIKSACTVRISKLSSSGSLTLISEQPGVVRRTEVNVKVTTH